MKFFLFLLFLFLLLDSPQGSTISHKRSIRALNTTLETNFNGTYERRNPCTNAEIETTSYVASHEFHHHTEENNWNDYTNKCSSIISSFLQALGNLVHFNHKQNGIFNFHINTSISQKQVDHNKPGKRTSCDTLPTITIEATNCKLSPRLSCGSLSNEQLCQDLDKEEKDAICEDSLNEEIYQRNQIPSEKAPRTPNFNQNSAINMPQCRNENGITPTSSLDATAAEDGVRNAWTVDDIFLPEIEIATSLESEIPSASALMGTKNSPQGIINPSENSQTNFQTEPHPDFFKHSVTLIPQLDPDNYVLSQKTERRTLNDPEKLTTEASESFKELPPGHPQYLPQTPYFGYETTPRPIADKESFYSNQFSDLPLREQQPIAYSKQHFDDDLNRQLPDSKFLSDQRPDDSVTFPDRIPKASFSPQEPIPIEIYQSKNTAFEIPPIAVGQNEKSFQQSLQSEKEIDNFEKTQAWPNADIFSEKTSYLSPNYLTKFEETPFNQIANEEFPQEPNLMDYGGQSPGLEFSARYPKPTAQVQPKKNTPVNTFADQNGNEATKERTQLIDYPREFFKSQSEFEGSLGSVTLDDSNDQAVPFSVNFSTSDIKKQLTDSTTWTSNERSTAEKPFYDANNNQLLSTPSPERPPFYFTNESPFFISESQKSVPHYSEENSDESSTEKVTDAELSLSSEQYQSVARPESSILLDSSEQYDNVEEAKHIPESNFFDPFVQPDSELTIGKPYLRSYSTTPENQANSDSEEASLQYPTGTTSNQKFSSSYDSTSDYESFSPSEGDTFSDEYLTTLPPEQDSSENFQKILTTLDPYQNQPDFRQTSFPSALEGEFASTFPGRILNDNAMSPTSDGNTLGSEQSTNDIYTPRTPVPISFDDYQDSLYSKPDVESSFTTPVQPVNENTYEPTTESNLTNDEKIYSDESQPTIPTVYGTDQLKQQPSPYSNQNSDLTLEQPLNYASDISLPTQNFGLPKSRPQQLLEKLEGSLPDVKPFSDRQYNDFSSESFKTEGFMNYDSEIPPDSLAPELEQYSDDNVLISDESKQKDLTPYFSEDLPQRSQIIFSPQPFTPDNNKGLFPDRSSFENIETTPSDFSAADDYFESIIPKVDLPAKFSKDSDAKPKQFFSEFSTTPLPSFSLPSEDFSPPSNNKIILENPLDQSQAEESLASLDQSVDENFPSQFEETAHDFSAPFRDVNKFDSDFQIEKQPFESETTEEEPTQSPIPVYKSQSDQPFSYSTAAESLTPYDEKQYVAADQPKIHTIFFPEQKSFTKPPTSDLPEYDSTTSEYQLTDSYSINDSDNSESLPVVDQQTRETTDRESTLNSFNRFSDFYPKEPSADFFPSAERPLIQKFDSSKEQTEFYLNNQQPNSDVFEPQFLTSTIGNDQTRSMEFLSSSVPESQLESLPSSSDDKPLVTFSEKTPLDFPSQTDSLALTKNEKLQSDDFQTPDSLAFTPYSQPQKVPSYSNYHLEDFSKDPQSSSVEELGSSVVPPESYFTKPETYRNINRSHNRQTAAEFNAFQSPQRGPETFNQFPSVAPLQSTKYDDKEVVPNNDYSSILKSTSQLQPSVYDYNKKAFRSYSKPDIASKYQPYQSEPLLQTLEEYSDIIPTAEREIPFDIDETTAPSIPEVSPLLVNEQPEYSQLAPEQQLKPQSSHDKLLDLPGENIEKKTILLPPQTSNFENIPFFEVKSDESVTSGLYPVDTGAYEQDTAGIDYSQPKSKELDYLDDSSNTNFDVSTPDLSNPIQSSIASPTSDFVPNVQFRPNDLTSFPQSPASTSYQLNNNSNKPSQRNSAIPLRYSQSEKEISFVTDNVSPQARPTTAVYNDKEITEISSTPKPQPQTTLNFADQFSDDNISEQLSDSPDRQYQITPNNVPSEFELFPPMQQSVSTQRNVPDFGTSDKDPSNQLPVSFQSQTQQLDVMTDSSDQTQNNFDSKLFPQAPNVSPLHTTTTTQSQHEPSIIKTSSERLYNSQERFSPETQPTVNLNNGPVSVEYQQDPSIHSVVYDQFSSNVSPREQRYFSKALPYPEAQRVAASRYSPQTLDPRDKFQTQPYITPSSRYPVNAPLINSDKNRFPSGQRFDSQSYPVHSPNQYPNYNVRARPNEPTSNFYSDEPGRQPNRASSQYFTSDAVQGGKSFESSLPFIEPSPDQTIKNADSPSYDDYDPALSSQLPNEKLLEYDEDVTPEFYAEKSQTFQAHRQQDRGQTEEDPREGSDDFLTEANLSPGFSRKADSYDFQDRSSRNNEPPPFMSSPAEKELHSNPLLQTLESHLTFPFQEHLGPPASYASFEDTEKESPNDSFAKQSKFQNKFRIASVVPPYSEGGDSETDFVDYQRSQPLNGIDTAHDVTNTQQPDSHALVSDPNIPSNKPGEDCVSWSGQNPNPLLCPFDPVLKGNMTAPSYYILISKLPVRDDGKEHFKVEKVYLGDGMLLNCTLSSGETFPTSLYTPIPFSAADTVKPRTKSDFA